MPKATQRFELGTLTRSDLVDLADKLKQKSSTEIFRRLGVKRFVRQGSYHVTPGFAALQGLPKKAPVRVINEEYDY